MAILILLISAYKYTRHLRGGLFENEKKKIHAAGTEVVPYKWLDKKTISIFDHAGSPHTSTIRRGDFVQIFEEASTGQRCFLGLFFFVSKKENRLVFRATKELPKSNLSAWARSRRVPLTISWQFPSHAIHSMHNSMLCRRWFEMKKDHKETYSSVSSKFFLSSRQFSSVSTSDIHSDVKISPHGVRSGWLIQAPAGRHELIVRDAESGILQSLPIFVEESKKKGSVHTRGTKSQVRKKMSLLIIPGWD